MRMNFQDAMKEISEQIKNHLKDKQIEAISSLLTNVIGASFAANAIQLASPKSGNGSEVNSYWSCITLFSPPNTWKKRDTSIPGSHGITLIGAEQHIHSPSEMSLTPPSHASFVDNVIQLTSPDSGNGSEVNSYWSCTRLFSPHPNTRH